MFAPLKKFFKWNSNKSSDNKKAASLIMQASAGLMEEILFWKKLWLSLSSIVFINVIFIICIHQQITFIEFLLWIYGVILCFDAFETWLKHKHRTGCLKKLTEENECKQINSTVAQIKIKLRKKWMEFVYLRETNHAKAFLLLNIILSTIFIMGYYINGYLLVYSLIMLLCTAYKLAIPMQRLSRKIHQIAVSDSDGELEGLIPEVSEVDIKLLSFEPENVAVDEKQSLDYWKPVDVPIEEASDSSEGSSIVTNLSMTKTHTLDNDMETSDSEDEYIPMDQQKKPLLQSTLQIESTSSWGNSAYNALFNLTGAVANMMYSTQAEKKRKSVSSIDSSDGFEMVDKNDLM